LDVNVSEENITSIFRVEDTDSRFLQNIDNYLSEYTVPIPMYGRHGTDRIADIGWLTPFYSVKVREL
jgi:hypothetical protein